MSSFRRIPAAASVAVASAVAATLAQAASPSDEVLSEVVITDRSLEATTPLELSRYGYDVEFVTAEQVRNAGFVDAVQAIEMLVPGVHVAPQAGAFSYINLALQGSRPGDVLWTVDGVRINNRLFHATSPTDTLPAGMIERIEVLKGSHGIQYGTAAIAGVVNVVTRSFSDEFGGAVSLGTDSRDGRHVDAWGRGALGRHHFVAWASKDKTDGFRPYTALQPTTTTRDRRYNVQSFGLKYGFDFTEALRLSVTGIHTDGRVDFATPSSTDVNERDEEILSVKLDYTPDDRFAFYVKGYHHDWDTDYYPLVDQSAPDYWGFKDTGLTAATKLNLTPGLEYHLGYEFQKYTGRDDYMLIAEGGEKVHAVFGQVRTTDDFSERARVSAGLRHNDTGDSKATVWTASGVLDVTQTFYVQASLGTSFRLPDAEQMLTLEPGYPLGNQELEPEESFNLNAGFGGSALMGERAVNWSVTGWRRKIDNLIIVNPVNPPPNYSGIWVNSDGEVKASGVELQLGTALTDLLSVDASYVFSRERNAAGVQLQDRPKHSGKFGVRVGNEESRWGADLAVKYVGSTYAALATPPGNQSYGDFFVANLAGHWFFDSNRQHRLGLRVENLFDKEYVTRIRSTGLSGAPGQLLIYGNRGTPRTLYGSYTFSF